MADNLDTTVNNTERSFLSDSRIGYDKNSKENVNGGQNIVPLMIQHFTESSGELRIWGIPVHMVTFVGIVRKLQHCETKITYEIEDETGSITVLHWLQAEQDASEQLLPMNTYVRVHGYLKIKDSRPYILVSSIRSITDLNELTSHLLEVIFTILKAKRHAIGVQENLNNVSKEDNTSTGFTKEQAIVFNIIHEANSSFHGIERSFVKRLVPNYLLPQVDGILQFLTFEGHIYTTETNNHFRAT